MIEFWVYIYKITLKSILTFEEINISVMDKQNLVLEIMEKLKGLSVREAEEVLYNVFSKLKELKVI